MPNKRGLHFFSKTILAILLLTCFQAPVFSQPFVPVPVTGFNHDVVAESGTSSLTNTTIAMDGVTQSNKVMYTVAFRITNNFGGGGLPDNGTITDAAGSYQMAAYNSNNALLLQRTQTGDLSLTTPAKFNSLRVLALTTEGTSLVNVRSFYRWHHLQCTHQLFPARLVQ
ncbi:MAG: hypothetical protein IPP31_10505 [Chitinophagaceae bacterium]|nr:hypothetical protein [Chitinophagaceae bacterium]